MSAKKQREDEAVKDYVWSIRRRAPGTYRTLDAGIEVIVDIPESASWVEDQFPDEVAYVRAAALDEAIAAVGELPAYKLPNVSNPFVEYAAVLEALRGKR